MPTTLPARPLLRLPGARPSAASPLVGDLRGAESTAGQLAGDSWPRDCSTSSPMGA